MSGEMSLWEYGAIIYNWNERQPKDDAAGIPEYRGPMPTEEEQAEMRYQTALTVERAQSQSGH